MKKLVPALLAALTLAAPALAQSAKSSIQLSELTLVPEVKTTGSNQVHEGPWTDILSTSLRTSQQKDAVVTVSLEAGLGTDTLVRSKTGSVDASSAKASIEVRVLVDGAPALPGVVTFAQREQQLIAKFGGILDSCYDSSGDGVITSDECTFTDEELRLVLKTLNANAFVFALDDLGSGVHSIVVQARVVLRSEAQTGEASAAAWVGKGTVSVEEVRLVKDQDITL